MAVKIRLRRTGKRNAPAHRIVVADKRSPRDGRFIETLGLYDPRAKIEKIDLDRAEYWLGKGAQTSETVDGIIKRAREGISLYDRRLKREAEERRKAEEEAAAAAKVREEAASNAEEEAEAEKQDPEDERTEDEGIQSEQDGTEKSE